MTGRVQNIFRSLPKQHYQVGKFILNFPPDHILPKIQQANRAYDTLHGDLIAAVAEHSPKGVFVDIGANVGDTAAMLATHADNPVLCVDGNVSFAPYLRQNIKKIGRQVQAIVGFVVTEKEPSPPNMEGRVMLREVLAKARAMGEEICLVKTDTDGHDALIVDEVITETDAVVFFECDVISQVDQANSPWPSLFERLDERGYSAVIFDNHGLPMLVTEQGAGSALRDLTAYVSLQWSFAPIRIHYLDAWLFPKNHRAAFESAKEKLRQGLMKPYGF